MFKVINNTFTGGKMMLELYYSKTCPYCQKVFDFFSANGIEYDAKDVSEKINHDKLMELGKLSQVPFLVDTTTGKTMYESDSIISYVGSLTK